MALISMKHVTKIYPKGTRPALDDVDLEIERGNFVFLVGASGSGKSTLLSLLLHEELATDGEIRVAGNDLRRLSNRRVPQYRRSLGFVFQDYKLLTNKTVWQNVAFALEVIGTRRSTIRSLVPQVLKTVGLTGKESNFPHELSGGEAQRVAIARAYVNHPQILLADEPTGNLDPTTSLGIMEVLDAINRTGTTVVMATHNEEIVNSMRKRVVELHSGKIVRDERNGSYDSAKFFPDADVAAKAHQALKSGAAGDVAEAAAQHAAQTDSGTSAQAAALKPASDSHALPSSQSADSHASDDKHLNKFRSNVIDAEPVRDSESERDQDGSHGSDARSRARKAVDAEGTAQPLGHKDDVSPKSTVGSERPASARTEAPQPGRAKNEVAKSPRSKESIGSVGDGKSAADGRTSADRYAESGGAPGANEGHGSAGHSTNETTAGSRVGSTAGSTAGTKNDTVNDTVNDIVNGTVVGSADEPNEGIARLAQSVHSGKKGRYGKAFEPVENTLTWGKGITADDVRAAAQRPPTPPSVAQRKKPSSAGTQADKSKSARQSPSSKETSTQPPAEGHEEAKQ